MYHEDQWESTLFCSVVENIELGVMKPCPHLTSFNQDDSNYPTNNPSRKNTIPKKILLPRRSINNKNVREHRSQ